MRIKKFFNINNNNREGDEAGEHQNEEMDLDQSLNSEEDPDPSNANLNGDSENTLCFCLTTENRCRRCHLKVCNFCSDSLDDDDSVRVHRVGDRRCHTEEACDVPIPIDERALVRVIFTKFLL